MIDLKSGRLMVGIDPGVHTGFAIWHLSEQRFTDVRTTGIVDAMRLIHLMRDVGSLHSVRFEDARLRKWFGTKGREALQGAGSIKRDCSIWQEFMDSMDGVPYLPVSPLEKGLKLNAKEFARMTKWEGRTSQHARDAAMLIYGV